MKLKRPSFVSSVVLFSITYESLRSCAAAEIASYPLIPHHVQRARRLQELGIDGSINNAFDQEDDNDNHNLRRRTVEGAQMGALYYGKGTHYVDLWCGSPHPQRQTVIVDTGSAVTAFPCSGCEHCGAGKYHINNAYDETNSSTFSVGSCDDCDKGECSDDGRCILKTFYAENSWWSAFKARDRCYLGGPHNVPLLEDRGSDTIDPDHAKALTIDFDFGCQTDVGGLFKTQLADGIMGMEDDSRSFWSQLYKSGKAGPSKQFSLCFSRPSQYNRTGTGAGALTLGGSDTRLHLSPMVFATRKNKNGYYKVHIRKVYLRHGKGGESAQSIHPSARVVALDIKEELLNTGGVIVDSGTTATYFNKIISPQFRSAFKELTGRKYNNNRWQMMEDELATLPTILVQLEGERGINKHLSQDPSQVVGLAGNMDPDYPHDVILAIPPTHYMELKKDGRYTPQIYDTENAGSVLGANAITGHDVLFDMDRQVVGWAESHCDYHNLVTGNGFKDVLKGLFYREEDSYDSDSDEDDDDDSDSDERSGSDDDDSSVNATDTKIELKPFDSGSSPFESVSGFNVTGYEKENGTDVKKEETPGTLKRDPKPIFDQGQSLSNNSSEHEVPKVNNMDLDDSVSKHLDQATNSVSHTEDINANSLETDVLASSYSRGGVLLVLGIVVVFGRWCIGKIFSLSRSLSTSYKKLEESEYYDDSQPAIDDDPLDEEQRVCIKLRRRNQPGGSSFVFCASEEALQTPNNIISPDLAGNHTKIADFQLPSSSKKGDEKGEAMEDGDQEVDPIDISKLMMIQQHYTMMNYGRL